MTSLPPTEDTFINKKTQKQSLVTLLLFLLLLFITLHTVNLSMTSRGAPCFLSGGLTFRQLTGQPIQALVQTRTLRGTGGLDVPSSAPQVVQTQFVGEFADSHGVGKILFVSKH